jgi:hypothetical protein
LLFERDGSRIACCGLNYFMTRRDLPRATLLPKFVSQFSGHIRVLQ